MAFASNKKNRTGAIFHTNQTIVDVFDNFLEYVP